MKLGLRFLKELEISPNFEYLITLPGFAKFLKVVFIIISLGLGSYAYENEQNFWKEDFFLISLAICLPLSFLYLLAHCLIYELVISSFNRYFDSLHCFLTGIVIGAAGILILISGLEINSKSCQKSKYNEYVSCAFLDEKIGASIFAIISSILSLLASYLILKVQALE